MTVRDWIARRKALVIMGLVAVLLLVAAAGGVTWTIFRSENNSARPDTAKVDAKGGTAWNEGETVGVRVAPGGVGESTIFSFKAPERELPESPLGDLADVLVPAVDITPSATVTAAEVVFKIDPARLPAAPASPDPAATQPTMANAGVEVFNETLGAWVPIPSTAEGNLLVAKAPHFTNFRAVVSKIGKFVVNVGKKAYEVVQTAVLKPIDRIWNTAVSVVKEFAYSITGQFNPDKFRCEGKDGSYKVSVNDSTGQGKFDACVVKSGDGSSLVVKNGLALPFAFAPRGDVPGLTPVFGDDGDLIELAHNFGYLLQGKVAVPGLNVGSFTIGDGLPSQFTIDGHLSWAGVALDILVAVVTVILPKAKMVAVEYRSIVIEVRKRLTVLTNGKLVAIKYEEVTKILETVVREVGATPTLAGQAGLLLASINCGIASGNLLKVSHPRELPEKLAQITKDCLDAALRLIAGEQKADLGAAVDLLHNLASSTKVIFETGQFAGVLIVNLFTRSDNAKAALTVRKTNPALEPFVSTKWEHACGDIEWRMTVRADYTGQWTMRYPQNMAGGDPNYKTYTTKFHLIVEGGKPTAVFGDSDFPQEDRPPKGSKTRFQYTPGDESVVVAADGAGGASLVFYKGDYSC